jgi:hypothetical protein
MMAKPKATVEAPARRRELADFRPQRRNANKHTVRGLALLDDAMSRDGYVAPMTVAADGEAIDGSARMERAAERFPGVEPLVVEHDGTRPIVMVRTDIPNAATPMARRIAVAANRIAEVDLEWDAALLKEMVDDDDGFDLGSLGFDDDELAAFDSPEPEPPGEFPAVAEDIKTEHECPRCHYRYSGGGKKAAQGNGE